MKEAEEKMNDNDSGIGSRNESAEIYDADADKSGDPDILLIDTENTDSDVSEEEEEEIVPPRRNRCSIEVLFS